MNADKIDIEDLLSDESFIHYCRQSSIEDVAFWENFIKTNPGKAELVREANEKFVEIFNVLASADLEQQVERLNNSINISHSAQVIKMEQPLKKKAGKISGLIIKVCAAAMLVAGLFISIRYINVHANSNKIFTAACGERKNIQLPDGSYVTLNAASTIEINNDFGSASRDVYLQGEAFFDVKHNEKIPFIVHTTAMDVKALGTAFNVKAYQNEKFTEASLIRGLVEVTLKEEHNSTVLLHPNEKIMWKSIAAANIDSKELKGKKNDELIPADSIKRKIGTSNDGIIKEIAWKSNKLVFEDEPFEEIALLLERWYNAKITFNDNDIRNYRFTGIFEKEDLNTLLDLLKESRDFNYTTEPGEIIKINLSK